MQMDGCRCGKIDMDGWMDAYVDRWMDVDLDLVGEVPEVGREFCHVNCLGHTDTNTFWMTSTTSRTWLSLTISAV